MNAQNPSLRSLRKKALLLGSVGAILLGVSAFIWPDRAWANMLASAFFLVTIGLGGAVFLALANVCGAGWHVAFRRIPEALTGLLPIGGLLLLATLGAQLSRFTWHHHGTGDPGTFWFKEMWLDSRFFLARAFLFILIWILFSRILVRNSIRQDETGNGDRRINAGISVVFLAIFAVTFSLAGIDWIMALEPMWFSTMWGVYQFSGLMMATLACIVLGSVFLRSAGPMQGIFRDDHLHDLGKLLLGFSCFWMYIWFSQYMLIWYSNIPEETFYFEKRMNTPWLPITIGNLVLNWIIPFFVLLPRPSKRNQGIMVKIAVVVLLGRWVDLSVMIFPVVVGEMPLWGVPEIAAIALLFGLGSLLFLRSFTLGNCVPRNDPFLAESMHYHT